MNRFIWLTWTGETEMSSEMDNLELRSRSVPRSNSGGPDPEQMEQTGPSLNSSTVSAIQNANSELRENESQNETGVLHEHAFQEDAL